MPQIEMAEARPIHIMEVCGGHTHAIFRYGVETMLPDGIELIHGPGCPVCVLPMGRVDDCVALAQHARDDFHHLRRCDASARLERKPAAGQGQWAPMCEWSTRRLTRCALPRRTRTGRSSSSRWASRQPCPAPHSRCCRPRKEGIKNFSLFCNHITIIPTIKAILDSPDLQLDGFLGPGHVSMVIGNSSYRFIAEHYKKPLVIAGFEPLDILQAIWMVLKQIAEGRTEIENQYNRVVPDGGNTVALDAIGKVFELREFFEWRGLGSIDHSGVRIREEYARVRRGAQDSPCRPSRSPIRNPANAAKCSRASSSPGTARSSAETARRRRHSAR